MRLSDYRDYREYPHPHDQTVRVFDYLNEQGVMVATRNAENTSGLLVRERRDGKVWEGRLVPQRILAWRRR